MLNIREGMTMLKVTSFIFKALFILLVMFKSAEASEVENTISVDCPTPDISKIQLIYPASGTPLTVTWNNSGGNVASYKIYNSNHKLINNTVNPSFTNKVPPLGKNQAANYDYYFQAVCKNGTLSALSGKYIAKAITKAKTNVIKCWGYNGVRQVSPIPVLTNPSMVSAGEYETCAIADEGKKCWGDNTHGQVNLIPALINPSMMSAGHFHTCVISEEYDQ
jgi:hypothetical protein